MNREPNNSANSSLSEAKDVCNFVCSIPYSIIMCIFCPTFYTTSVQRYNVELLLYEIKMANEQLLIVMNDIESQIKPLKNELKIITESFRKKSYKKMGKFKSIETFIANLDVNELRDFNDIRRTESKINNLEMNLAIYCKVNEELIDHENNLEAVLTDVSLSDSLAKREYKDLFKFIDGLEIGELIKQTKDELVSLKREMGKKAPFTKDKDYLDSAKRVMSGMTDEQPSITNTFLVSSSTEELDEDQTHTLASKSLRVAVL